MYEIYDNRIILTKGDSFFAVVSMTNKETGEPYTPQDGDVIRFGIKKSLKEGNCIIEKTIPNSTLLLSLDPSDTEPLAPGKYVYDIELTYANGDKDTFINKAQFILVDEVI